MRALMTAGPALRHSGIAGYNCSYLPIDSVDAFHEVLYILMHGTGVGFSVERAFTGARRARMPRMRALHPHARHRLGLERGARGWGGRCACGSSTLHGALAAAGGAPAQQACMRYQRCSGTAHACPLPLAR